ncbi:receptor-type guanylate cyclase gcy-28-like [Littorina saxatilis]|uniref:receptor-type guanylate cyclase gcy-28-like n=1 Tax=Littorina saxatilis TaxID=31220 RepID=UPI0038B59BE8
MCASPDTVRELLIQARDLTFDNEQYVFINIDLFDNHRTPQPWLDAADTEKRNAKARQTFESLMTVTLRKPASEEYRMFSRAVNRRATYRYQDFTLSEYESRDSVSSFVSAFHDAVLLYAVALNETLEAGGDVTDGVSIPNRMRNRTFQGIAGTVSIDKNGDRNPDYSLFTFNTLEAAMEVVGTYYGSSKRYEQAPSTSLD